MISKYLKALIESNNRIIIPDFGAFMVQDTPEGKQITFNDFLKFNDGLLINQIIKTDKISKNEATEQVKGFISAVEKSFTEKKPYQIEGLGHLTKDGHSNIKFETKIEAGKTVKAATDIKPTIELAEEPKKTTTKKTDKPAAAKATTKAAAPKAEKKTENKPAAKEEIKKPEAVKAEKTIETKAKAVEPAKTEIKKEITTKPAPASTATKKTTTVNTKQPESNTSTIIIVIVAALILIGGGAWILMKMGVIGGKTPEPVVVEVPTPVVQDTIIEDTIVEEPKVIEEPAIEQEEPKYYLIGGSFKVAANADRFNQKLIDEGYNSEIVVRNNGFNCVSYKNFVEWSDVVAEWRTMKTTNPSIWILKK